MSRPITIATYNIQYTLGRDGRYDLERIVREIGAADVIGLQEVETHNPRSGDIDQAAAIAALLPEHHYVFGPGVDVDASHRDGEGRLVRRRRQFGNMLLSRFPILWSKNHLLPKIGTVTTASPQRAMLECCLDVDGRPLRAVSVHFDHCDAETRLPQVRYALQKLMLDHASDGATWSGPAKDAGWAAFGPSLSTRAVVLMGDLNFDRTSEEYALFVGRMSENYGRLNNRNGFADAFVAGGHDETSGHSHENGRRIDHIMVWAPLARAVKRSWIDNEAAGSDHMPVWMEFDAALLPEADRF
jgi:endonuclease/exonuclease/phosphatase family metal-dependent hydrolase